METGKRILKSESIGKYYNKKLIKVKRKRKAISKQARKKVANENTTKNNKPIRMADNKKQGKNRMVECQKHTGIRNGIRIGNGRGRNRHYEDN